MPTLEQDLVPALVTSVPVKRLTADSCQVLINRLGRGSPEVTIVPLGISLRLSKKGFIEAVALADSDQVFQITVTKDVSFAMLASVLKHPRYLFVAFGMARVALLIHHQFGVDVRSVDLSTMHDKSPREQQCAAHLARKLWGTVRAQGIHNLWWHHSNKDLCLRTWLSACIAEESASIMDKVLKVDTRNASPLQLACLAQLVLNVELLEAEQPTQVDNDFEHVRQNGKDKIILHNARFKTKIRDSSQTIVHFNGGQATARAVGLKGRQTQLQLLKGRLPAKVTKVRVFGREEATNAELARDEFVLGVLRGTEAMDTSSFVRMLWFPPRKTKRGKKVKAIGAVDAQTQITTPSYKKLNASQRAVVKAMVSADENLVIVHGPPGTGKTTTIAAALEHWERRREPAWVIAHSNVGVKNIAESLVKRKIDFKIVVSKDFYYEWHEHHYVDISDHLVKSDKLFGQAAGVAEFMGRSKVILCTVSMLSHPGMDNVGVFRHVPMERLVVDEASQIDTFEFMHLFNKFMPTLGKVCMFGDPKQLPPFGKETAPKMKTIFDFQQFHTSAYFLDTQYRMPVPLGDFVSKHVYGSKLKSEHKITANDCVKLIDVRKGKEESAGSSWKNMEEIHTIANLVKKYYRHPDFCIITPYDGQRAAIVAALKAQKLPHENVYNVDSYQVGAQEAGCIHKRQLTPSAPVLFLVLDRLAPLRCCDCDRNSQEKNRFYVV
ncbi:P-loop containing nucleoside triphosphate hydrolase protein [Dichomitus squalens]|uniref:P-loop containing nucleoside triphosphate hydrolase protein n=1 Tax=Dichomitus squalens TaxID=114155 RepID=A0A4Q9MIP6_9APHY|nr:P-loop containing nucleoside triphosphate hydrolase protein [Dichomitus squalens]